MKLLLRCLRARRRVIALFALCLAVFSVTLALYRLPAAAILYPAALCLGAGLVFLALDLRRSLRIHRQLTELARPEALTVAPLPASDRPEEQDYQELIRLLRAHAAESQAADAAAYRDMIDYYTVWAHQIKTPIASMKLRLQDEDSASARRLRTELLRIEQYVGMVMAFLRLDGSGDYVFREYDLDDIVRQAVRKFAPAFIDRHLRLCYQPVHYRLVTDEKWLAFVIEQLLSNALKYTREGCVTLSLCGGTRLCIADTGIGITPEDLPRIFDKGYTGVNGRREPSSSGLGLYLCRQICGRLGIGLSAASEVGCGTTFTLDLAQPEGRVES